MFCWRGRGGKGGSRWSLEYCTIRDDSRKAKWRYLSIFELPDYLSTYLLNKRGHVENELAFPCVTVKKIEEK